MDIINCNIHSPKRQPEDSLDCKVVQRFRSGLIFKAHRLLYHSTLGLRVIKKKTCKATAGCIRHNQQIQDQILVLAFGEKILKSCKVFPLRSEAGF